MKWERQRGGSINCEGLPKTVAEARRVGLSRYFTGKPCIRGHIAARITAQKECIECKRLRGRQYWPVNHERITKRLKIWQAANADRVREYSRAYRDAHRAEGRKATNEHRARNLERIRAERRAKYAANPDFFREDSKRRHHENIEKNRERCRRWNKQNPEKAQARTAVRRSRNLGAEGRYSAEDVSRIRVSQNDKCACCRARLGGRGHVDHIIPLARGGSNWPSNIQLLCAHCNLSKHDKDPVEFMRSQGRLI